MEGINMGFVVVMGIVTVFICLVCLIIITMLMSKIIVAIQGKKTETVAVAPVAAPAFVAQPTVNKQQLVAAIGAAIAEDMGTDVSHIKIHSIRKI